jgi:hypothetical protein
MLGVKLDRAKIGGFATPDLATYKQETIVRHPVVRHSPRNQRRNYGMASGKTMISRAKNSRGLTLDRPTVQ